ncbi:transcriptional regulator LeuO [Serratia sp. AKBS12]|uniref:transcriptional regulator LeuO n=1 Tax=Serratia sp. AKBS12 TaxID=2974597 RepID=UPI00216647F5|nr:transcriptional regulator LeuO [Serratia sp. AKBS12]MCS3405717.1 transcriptional regulator LeuO [Serratia sp. AKBS12]HEI8866842.1 transcriptional regulator LeuO [Serratia odorifera]
MSEYNSGNVLEKGQEDIHLRGVDLNLLTVFDAVMQMQNITRAANVLGMSQPAVSNAVARLKIMFNDELFVRFGRGIQPTLRARQLFGPVRQALQLVRNELPGSGFDSQTSDRLFSIAICSPLDLRLTAKVLNNVKCMAPHIRLRVSACFNDYIEHQLRFQEVGFVIGYSPFAHHEFQNQPLFSDPLVLVVSQTHPRIHDSITQEQLLAEHHAVVSLDNYCSFSKPYYLQENMLRTVMQQCTDLYSALHIVAHTDRVAMVPRWFAEQYTDALNIRMLELPSEQNQATCYLTWHESAERDKGHQWIKSVLSQADLLR